MSIRDRIVSLAPVWLRRKWGSRLLWGLGLQFDAAATLLAAARKASLPDYAPPDALPLIGDDRGIIKGYVEPDGNYRDRLKLWQSTRRLKGTRFALMEQASAYMFPAYRTYIVQRTSLAVYVSPGFFGYLERSWEVSGGPAVPVRWIPLIDMVYVYPFAEQCHFALAVDMTAQHDGAFVIPTVTEADMMQRNVADTLMELAWEWGSAHSVPAAVFLAFPIEGEEDQEQQYEPPLYLLHRECPEGIIIGRHNYRLSINPTCGVVESDHARLAVETAHRAMQLEQVAVEYFLEWETYAEHQDHYVTFDLEIRYRTGAGLHTVTIDSYTRTVPMGQTDRQTVRRVARYTLPIGAIAWHVQARVIDNTDFDHTLHGTAMLAIHTHFVGP